MEPCTDCNDTGRRWCGPHATVACSCSRGRLQSRMTSAWKYPGADPEMDDLAREAAWNDLQEAQWDATLY